MRAVLQRVSSASVTVNGQLIASQGQGFLILLGIESEDANDDVSWLVRKIVNMRVFDDGEGRMNRSVLETRGEITVVSQFTLQASTKKGNRPSFIRAARPEHSEPLYALFCQVLTEALGQPIQRGKFGAMMAVSLVNDGPVTILLDSKSPE